MRREWRPVVGYESTYEVSNDGHVQRLAGSVASPRSATGSRVVRSRLLKPALVQGYPTVHLSHLGIVRQLKVHHLVMAAFVGPSPPHLTVNHKDGTRANNHVSNLEYVTMAANNVHAYAVCGKRNHLARGSANGSSKLTEAQAATIRMRRHAGEGLLSIARDYGVCIQTVANIAHGKIWRHV